MDSTARVTRIFLLIATATTTQKRMQQRLEQLEKALALLTVRMETAEAALSKVQQSTPPIPQPLLKKPAALLGRTFRARILLSGTYVEARLLDVDENDLFAVAQQYVAKKGLPWKIRKPHAWTDYNSAPHVTLDPAVLKTGAARIGDVIEVTLEGPVHHFVDPPSRWVVVEVTLNPPLPCPHGCHVSIGQERVK